MKKKFLQRLSLRMVMVLFVFFIMMASAFTIGCISFFLVRVVGLNLFNRSGPLAPLMFMLAFSVIMGTILTGVVGNRTLKPLRSIIDATHKVSQGDFSVRIATESVPEIQDLTDSFNAMVKELDSIETLRSDFISNFSHEFKTPIVSIRGFAKLLQDENTTEEERREYVGIIIQESERLAQLSTSVLDLTRLENTSILSEREYFFLDEQVRRTAALMEQRWREKGISVRLAMDSVTIYSDEDLLKQVWVNLLDNAIKFTGEGGVIDIAVKRSGNEVVFSISDTGCGMDEQTMNHLYDKFYQGDTSHGGAGNGLGLAMVRHIVGLCGGTIEVQSAPGQGSTFAVTLPVEMAPQA